MTTKHVYLAARYSRHPQMREYRDVLKPCGYEVTSRWIDMHGGKYPSSFTPEILNSDPEYCALLGQHDVEDVQAADLVISFTDGAGGKGGRHVEFGLAVALGKELVVIGPREHIFHTLPQVQHYDTWTDFLRARLPPRTADPNETDPRPDGQVWVWLGGANPPRWEIRGTGLVLEAP